MLLYKYDKNTKEYIGCFEAYFDPLESIKQGREVYAFPPCTTTVAPVKPKEGYTVVFNNDRWEEVEDHRGLIVWDKGEEKVITELGSIPSQYSLERVLTLEELRAMKVEEVNKKYNDSCEEKIIFNNIEVNIESAADIKKSIETFGEFGSVNIGDEVVNTKEAEKIVKFLYIRSRLLLKRKKELLEKIKNAEGKREVEELEIIFKVDEEKVLDYPVEELQEKLK